MPIVSLFFVHFGPQLGLDHMCDVMRGSSPVLSLSTTGAGCQVPGAYVTQQ